MFCSPSDFKLQQWQLGEKKSAVNRALAQAGRKPIKEVRNPSKSSAIRPSSASASSERKRKPIFIKLAEENICSEFDSDSSRSSYDSFNEQVTGRFFDIFFLLTQFTCLNCRRRRHHFFVFDKSKIMYTKQNKVKRKKKHGCRSIRANERTNCTEFNGFYFVLCLQLLYAIQHNVW